MFILKRASKIGPTGELSEDDYDVFDDTLHIGRIIWTPTAPDDLCWFWTISARAVRHRWPRLCWHANGSDGGF